MRRDTGEMTKAANPTEPEIRWSHFAPLCMDILLRFQPRSRLALPPRWGFAKAVLDNVVVQVTQPNYKGEPSNPVRYSLRNLFKVMAQQCDRYTDRPVPVCASWADMLDLLGALVVAPMTTIVVDKGAVAVAMPDPFWANPDLMFHPLAGLPEELRDEHGYVALLAGVYLLSRVRCGLAWNRQDAARHHVVDDAPKFPGGVVQLRDLLEELAKSPADPLGLRETGAQGQNLSWSLAKEPWDRTAAGTPADGSKDGLVPQSENQVVANGGASETVLWPPSQVWSWLVGLLPDTRLFSPKHWDEAVERLDNAKDARPLEPAQAKPKTNRRKRATLAAAEARAATTGMTALEGGPAAGGGAMPKTEGEDSKLDPQAAK
ncbi:MAG: hypothetical protein FJ100_22675 [Deltaproteobacteria bacterium]|nr:hypothetical protein [Deltaproteobacteria bacterium]